MSNHPKRSKDGFLTWLVKSLDFYKDLPKGLAQPTYIGASLSTGFLVLMAGLITYQIIELFSYQKTSEMLIDSLQEDQFVSDQINETKNLTNCVYGLVSAEH